MTVIGINHINIKAPKALLKEVKEFYTKILGLKVGFRPEFNSEGYWLYANNQPLVHLSENEKEKEGESLGHFDHFAFSCSDLKHYVQQLKNANIVFKSSYLPEVNTTQLFLRDPAGIRVELNFKNERF
ncbi:VOC family protein [Xanthovirga aplysinae]|uniref:VOC family protein n=1 Tax=Xanthovirga aplysinae TaxID=2529853 RepID=UPI0012BD31F8|nr:VOC family protein [Xanthovirga aplysinae]MTI30985.1 diguanylate cyclase [Xanthovirga aplysinae]